jgi:hypothetical protein
MASTPILPFAVWASGTNQNSVPANDNALRAEILQRNVNNATTAQPGSPSDGDTYIIQSTHTGAQWSTFTPKDLAIFKGGTWYAFEPVEGVKITVSGAVYIYTSGAWTATGGGGGGAVDSVNGRTGTVLVPTCIPIACSDETTALTTGVAKVTFRMPFAMTGVTVRASLTTAQTSGSIVTVDVNEGGSSILSTKLTIDNTEKTSATSATPPVVSDASLADDAEITIDIDQIGDGTAKGLKVYILGTV